jgi:DNA-binding NtrC family response regulator
MASTANPHGRLILLVDEEPTVLSAVTAILTTAGFRVMVAENGAAGLGAFLAAPHEIDLVLTDVVMPDWAVMVERIRSYRPDMRVVLMTAFSEAVIEVFYGAKFPLIRKPFLPDDLVRVVSANLDPPAASA